MSKTIDQKVVEMQFENQQFEKGVNQSMTSIDNLKKSLNFQDSAKGLENVGAAAKGVSLENLTSGIEQARSGFSVLEVAAISALATITSQATTAGLNLVKSLSLDQITAGFNKYAQKTSSIQTIMNATGKSLEEVNGQLERLLWFTDETSYNFVDMVGGIGSFTSAGVELETAVTAMQGIANWAAVSGKNASDATWAMRQLAQALGSGSVKLQDWRSIETLNMDTQEFKQTAMDTAVALGTLVKVGGQYATVAKGTAVSTQHFRDALKDGWLTTDVLMQTLDRYGGFTNQLYKSINDLNASAEGVDMTASTLLTALEKYDGTAESISEIAKEEGVSVENLKTQLDLLANSTYDLGQKAFRAGQEAKTFEEAIQAVKDAVSTSWMQIFENIFGDYNEAKVLWTDLAEYLYDIFNTDLIAFNELLSQWKALGGRNELFAGIYNLFDGFKNILDSVKNAIANVFPLITAEKLVEITTKFKNFTESIAINKEELERLKNTVEAILSPLKIAWELIKTVFDFVNPILTKVVLPVARGILDVVFAITGGIGQAVTRIQQAVSNFTGLKTIAEKWNKLLTPVQNGINSFFNTISGSIDSFFNKIYGQIDRIKEIGFKAWFKEILEKIAASSEAGQKFVEVLYKIKAAFDKVKSVVAPFFTQIKEYFKELNEINLENLKKAFGNISPEAQKLIDNIDHIKESFMDLFDKVKNSQFVQRVKEIFTRSADEVQGSKFIDVISRVLNLLYELGALLVQVIKPVLVNLWDIIKAISLELFDFAGDVLSGINIDTLFRGGIAAGIVVIAKSVKDFMDSTSGFKKGITNILESFRAVLVAWQNSINADTLKKIAEAVAVLTGSLLVLSFLDEDALMKGIAVISMLMVGLVYATKQIISLKQSVSSIDTLIKSLSMSYKIKSIMASLIELGIAVAVFGVALKIFAGIDTDSAWRALAQMGLVMAGMFGLLVGLDQLVTKADSVKIATMSAFILELAVSLGIVAIACKLFVGIDPIGLVKMLTTLGFALGEFAVAQALLNRLSKGNSRQVSFNILAMASSVVVLAAAAAMLTNIPWESLGKAGATLGGFLGILVLFQHLMTSWTYNGEYFKKTTAHMWEFIGVLTALTLITKVFDSISWDAIEMAGITILGFIALMAGVSLVSYALEVNGLSDALEKFSRSAAGFGIGIGATGVGILAFAASIEILAKNAALVPKAMEALATGIVILIESLASAAREIVEFLAEIITGLLESVVKKFTSRIKVIGEDIFTMLVEVLKIVDDKASILVQLLLDILVKVLEGVKERIGEITDLAIEIINEVFETIGAKFNGANAFSAFGLEAFIASMGLLVVGLSKIKPYMKDAIEVAVFIAAFAAAMSAVMVVLSGLDPVAVGVNTGCMIALTGFMAILVNFFNNMHVNMAAVVKGAAALVAAAAIIMVGFELIVAIMGAVAGLVGLVPENVRKTVMSGFDFLIELSGKVGELFGAFAGGIIAGFATKVSEALPTVADNLSAFMAKLTPFLDGLDKLQNGEKKIKAIKSVIEIFKELTSAAFTATLNAIPTLISKLAGYEIIGYTLNSFVDVVKDFYDTIQEKLPDGSELRVQNVVVAAQGMVQLAEQLIEDKDILNEVAGTELADFGENIGKYVAGLNRAVIAAGTGISPEAAAALESTISIGQKFSDFAKDLVTKDRGFSELWNGETLTLSEFANEVEWFAYNLTNAVWVMINGGIDFGSDKVIAAFDGMVTIGQKMVELQKALPTDTTLGLVNFITGARRLSLGEFGDMIANFGLGMSKYLDKVNGITISQSAYDAADVAQKLASIELPEAKGLFGLDSAFDSGMFIIRCAALGDGIKSFCDKISGVKNMDAISDAIGPLTSLAWLIAGLAGIDSQGAIGFSDALIRVSTGLEAFAANADKISSGGKMNPGYAMAIQISEGVVEGINFSRPYLIQLFTGLFNDINTALNANGDKNSAGYAMAISYTSGMVEGIYFSRPYLIELFSNLIDQISEVVDKKDIGKLIGLGIGTNIVKSIESQKSKVTDATQALHDAIKETFSDNEYWITIGYNMSSYLKAGLNQGSENIKSAASDLVETMKQTIKNSYTDFSLLGQNVVINFKDGIGIQKKYLVNKVKDLIKSINDEFDLLRSDLLKEGQNAMQSFLKGVVSGAKDVETGMIWAGRDFVQHLRDGSVGSYQVGWDFTEGFIQGMESLSYAANWSAWTIGHKAITYLKSGTESNSPSKAAREIGGFVGYGFILGMTDKIKDVNSAAYDLGDESINALADALNKASKYASDTMDLDPVIKPVLDLSEIQNGVTGINNILGNSDYQLGSVSGRLASSISLGGNVDQTIPVYNDSNVLVAIDTLGSRVDSLNDAISKMRVVLDSGEVVGGISNKMNKRFGEMEFAVARGVR